MTQIPEQNGKGAKVNIKMASAAPVGTECSDDGKSKSDYQYCPDHQTTHEASRALGSSFRKVMDPEGGVEDDSAVDLVEDASVKSRKGEMGV